MAPNRRLYHGAASAATSDADADIAGATAVRPSREPERGEPRETPCGHCVARMRHAGEVTCFWPRGQGRCCTKCAQQKQRCPDVLPAVSAAATAAQRWLLDNAGLEPAEARVNAEFKALIKAAVQARAKAGGLVAEEAADRLRSSGGATAYPTFTITTAPPAAAAPAASSVPAAADTAPNRPHALVDRALLSEMLSEMRKTNNLLKELVQSAGSKDPDREQFVALVQGEVSLRFS
ncbi:hypothetical protein NHJ13734_008509 [Beauveria thailandica]